ncbi:ATP synthase F1 subunit delta [Convivina intestini]|uniref:ATP synthase subunit delta n=1 Tax=Convivina intestini TaxID=1505726 RepID=A0A2U1D7V5_9LACO|nr:ATP synthase F1 subunit delta [Convivina intestini]PVY83773.1 ATP synthase F1 subcomplex delta subunit [Convivina intestini]CAH1854833.1 ATP synthase subunit delta [Convivina intestini]SDB93009.1 F-type H+-transporting ATPase subunit delta [Leuconostocaceae bacterium R-53105]
MAKKTRQIVNQYAQAILELAAEQHNSDEVVADLTALKQVIAEQPMLLVTLASRELDAKNQDQLVNTLTKTAVPSVQNLLRILMANGRLMLLDQIIDDFLDLYKQSQGIVDVDIITALEVEQDQKAKLEAAFIRHSGAKQLNPTYQVDPTIIGGVIMQSKSLLVDGSLRTKITQMKAQLLG